MVLNILDVILDNSNVPEGICGALSHSLVGLRRDWQGDVVELQVVDEHIAEQDSPAEIDPAHEATFQCDDLVCVWWLRPGDYRWPNGPAQSDLTLNLFGTTGLCTLARQDYAPYLA